MLQNGWIVTNFIGLVVLLSIFVMTHVVAALMSFRMVTLLPHHLPRLIGFTSANRVDMDAFQQRAAWGIGRAGGWWSAAGYQSRRRVNLRDGCKLASWSGRLYFWSIRRRWRGNGGAESGMDSTLRATTDTTDQARGRRCLI